MYQKVLLKTNKNEVKKMTQKKWKNIDKKSRELVKKLLRSIGAETIFES